MAPRSPLAAERTGLLLILPLVAAVLFLAYYLGRSPSLTYVAAPLAVVAGLAILRRPRLGLLALIVVALVLPLRISTGTEVDLNPAALVVPALGALCLLGAMLGRPLTLPPSPIHLPLVLFLAGGLLSLGIGNLTWDPLVPRKDSFILVQLAQWAIFAFSAGALWLTAILADQETWLKRMTAGFLILGGGMALLRIWPPFYPIFAQITTGAVDRAPFWILLGALAGGQLLFNRRLRLPVQTALALLLLVTLYYAFFLEREGASTWIGLAVAGAVLFWLRLPHVRWPAMALILALFAVGVLFPAVYEFAGGDLEWSVSGQSRLILIERVIDVTMLNPITGLGPAAYRPYASMQPLQLSPMRIWAGAVISSHNNYVDLFSHGGLVGLGLFFWFVAEVALLGRRLQNRYRAGFAAGYVNGVLAVGAAALVIMALADWMLPFVYNIGFHGFQASVLVWLFVGGLVALENMPVAPENDAG